MHAIERPVEDLKKSPMISHLIELRWRFIKIIVAMIFLFICLLPYANYLYEWLSEPLRALLPKHVTMIATDVTATFLAPFKLNFFVVLVVLMPYILYQLWQFIAPALFQQEKKNALILLFCSIILFYSGIAFAYFVTLPMVLNFFIHIAPDSVAPMTDINSYLNFCIKLFLVFGATFEVPVLTILLVLSGIVSIESLIVKRRFIIVGCFFISMFITPPDALSMLMLAISMWLLFEVGLLFAMFCIKHKATP